MRYLRYTLHKGLVTIFSTLHVEWLQLKKKDIVFTFINQFLIYWTIVEGRFRTYGVIHIQKSKENNIPHHILNIQYFSQRI